MKRRIAIGANDIVCSDIVPAQHSLKGNKIRRRELHVDRIGEGFSTDDIEFAVKSKGARNVEIIPATYMGRNGFIWRYPERPDVAFIPPRTVMIVSTGVQNFEEILCSHHASIAVSMLKAEGVVDVTKEDTYLPLKEIVFPEGQKLPLSEMRRI